mgnify:CR=1 FL=1|jgi:hypothetical protein
MAWRAAGAGTAAEPLRFGRQSRVRIVRTILPWVRARCRVGSLAAEGEVAMYIFQQSAMSRYELRL